MAYTPTSYLAPQFQAYKNYWVKFYAPGTTTTKSISIDSTGNTLIAKAEINNKGFFQTAGSAIFIPFIDGAYDAWLFPNEADADSNDTSSALRIADDIISEEEARTNVLLNVEQTVNLSSGQLVVSFTNIDVNFAAIYVGSTTVDRGRLIRDIDYSIIDNANITLFNSYDSGSYCTAVYRDETSGYLPQIETNGEMYRRSLIKNLPFIDAAYTSLIGTYGYTQLYPQAMAIDDVAREIYVMRNPAGGGNSWAWIWVYDIDTGVFKTCFTFQAAAWESIIIRYVSSVRYIYLVDKSDNVLRADITVLPVNLSAVAIANTYAVEAFTQMAWDGNYFYLTDHQTRFQTSSRNYFSIWDGDFNRVGNTVLPIGVTGTFNSYLALLPKSQSIAFHKGKLFIGTGTVYHVGDDPSNISLYSGIQSVLIDGTNVLQALCRPDDAMSKMEVVTGHTNTLLENEGIYSAGNNLYALWVTLDSAQWTDPAFAGQGIAITLEMSGEPGVVDFSDVASGIQTPYNNLTFSNECWHDGQLLPNPVLLTDLTSFQDIIDMMNNLDMSFYTFGALGQTITDVDSVAIPVDSNLVKVTNINGAAFLFEVLSATTNRQYWIAGGGTSQAIRNITFTG